MRGTFTSDSSGDAVASWSETTRWGSLQTLSGKELYEAKNISPELTHKIIMRETDVTPRDRIKYGSREFRVYSVSEIGNGYTQILAMEVF